MENAGMTTEPDTPDIIAVYEDALWQVYRLSGRNLYSDEGREAALTALGAGRFAATVVSAVRELREEYDSEVRADDSTGALQRRLGLGSEATTEPDTPDAPDTSRLQEWLNLRTGPVQVPEKQGPRLLGRGPAPTHRSGWGG